MKIKIVQSVAGHADPRYDLADFGFAPGSVVDVHDDLAQAWIKSGVAIAAGRNEKLTMPVEVYTLRPAQAELPSYDSEQPVDETAPAAEE